MPQKALVESQEQVLGPTAASHAAELLPDLFAEIRLDSQRETDRYLEETEVPHGGE